MPGRAPAASPTEGFDPSKLTPMPSRAPSLGSQLKYVGRETAKQAAGAAPIAAGAYMGGALGEAVFPPGGGLIGAPIGAAIGGYAAPEVSHLTGKLLGEDKPPPTTEEATHSAKVGGLMEMGGPIVGKAVGAAGSKVGEVLGGKKDIAEAATKAAQGVGTETPAEMEARAAKAQQDMAAEHAAARQQADQHVAAQRDKLLEKHTKEAREETVKGAIGPAPETPNAVERVESAAGPAGLPGQGVVQRQQRFRDAIYGIKNRAQAELSNRFETVLKDFRGAPTDTTPVGEAAGTAKNFVQTNGLAVSPKVQKLVDEAETMGLKAKASSSSATTTYGGGKGYTAGRGAPRPPIPGMPGTGTTVDQMLGFRTRLGQALESVSGPTKYADRKALEFLQQGAEDSLPNVPGIDAVRAQWREFRHSVGDYDFLDKVKDASNPGDVASDIFNHPERGLQMTQGATPEEKQVLRDTLATWVDKKGANVITKDHAAMLKALDYPKPLTDPKAWVFEQQAVKRVGEIFDTAPQAKAKYFAALKEVRDHEEGVLAKNILALAEKQAKTLGPTGNNIMRNLDAIRDPVAKAKAALKAFQAMRPGGVSSEFEAAQREAGEAAIRGYEAGQPKGFMGMMQRYGLRMAAIGGLAAPFSSFGGSLAERGGIALGVAAASGRLMQAYQNSLRDPAAAAEFYDAIMNPGTRAGMSRLARATMNGLISEKLGTATAPPPPPATSSTSSVGPMSKDIERKQAIQIASKEKQGDEAHLDHIQDLNEHISSGKVPDIQHDLASGRMSNAEVTKLVRNDPPGLNAMFQGMSIDEAMDSFRKGSPEEKQLALPAIAQLLNDQGRNLQPQQRRLLMSQLRSSLTEQGET